jgi:hypothetical protein
MDIDPLLAAACRSHRERFRLVAVAASVAVIGASPAVSGASPTVSASVGTQGAPEHATAFQKWLELNVGREGAAEHATAAARGALRVGVDGAAARGVTTATPSKEA